MRTSTMLPIAAVLLLACDSGNKPKGDAPATIAGALKDMGEADANTAKTKEDGFKKLQEKAEAERKAEAAATFEKLIVVPDDGVGDRKAVCSELPTVYDQWRQDKLKANELALGRWNATKEPDLEKLADHCRKDPAEVGACQLHALKNAPKHYDDAAADEILRRCGDKFGTKDAG